MARLIGKIGDWVEIDRPAEAVFTAATDLEALFSLATERGNVDAERVKGAGPTAIGDRWRVAGKGSFGQRSGEVEVRELRPGAGMLLRSKGGGYRVETDVILSPLGPARTRLEVKNDLYASGLRAVLSAAALKLMGGKARAGLRRALLRAKEALEAQ